MTTTITPRREATIEDLYNVRDNGKAEIVNGELVLMSPTGEAPASAGFQIVMSLHLHAKRTGVGLALPDNAGFIVNLPNHRSFSLDASYHLGPRSGMRFMDGAPIFAVEIRSENDYGPPAERAIAAKRADYFAAGTQVVWDVDLLSDDVVRVYRADSPEAPIIYRRGGIAEAEPAVPGWTMPVDDLFD